MNMKTRWIVCLILLGSSRVALAEDQTFITHNYRQEVRDSLQELRSYLYKMAVYEDITPQQYKIETQRVHELALQMGINTQESRTMTVHERDRDIAMMDHIQQEASRWAAANSVQAFYGASLTRFDTPVR
jgi:hypothetical protein